MTSVRHTLLLLILAAGLSQGPVTAEWACEVAPDAHVDPCTTETVCGPGEDLCGEDEDAGDCCENSCHPCGLPCCTVMVMIPSIVPAQDASPAPDGRLDILASDLVMADADPLYHPPRA